MIERSGATLDYESFDYKHFDEEPLKLDEAAKKAAELRRQDLRNVYRIVPTDSEMNGFRVEKTPREQLFVDFLSVIARSYIRFFSDFLTFPHSKRDR
jgi:hypothetical protein